MRAWVINYDTVPMLKTCWYINNVDRQRILLQFISHQITGNANQRLQ